HPCVILPTRTECMLLAPAVFPDEGFPPPSSAADFFCAVPRECFVAHIAGLAFECWVGAVTPPTRSPPPAHQAPRRVVGRRGRVRGGPAERQELRRPQGHHGCGQCEVNDRRSDSSAKKIILG